MTDRAEVEVEALHRRAASDENVVGLVTIGSRAAGAYVEARSDFDVYVVLASEADGWRTPHGSPVEVWPMTLAEYRGHALPGSPDAWNRPSFINARVELDRLDGEIGELTRRKARLEPEEATEIGSSALDDYINSMYRSLRNLEAGRVLEGRLDGLESISPLLTTVFALDGRVRPFNKWLVHELDRRPVSWADLVTTVDVLARDPSAATQRSVFNELEPRARAAGLGRVIDEWEPDVAWLRGGPSAS